MKLFQGLLLGSAACAILAPQGAAHFRLIEPASWLQESQIGDPQKMAPCGGTSADPGKPSGAVTNVQGGEKLHIKLRETVFHPGFYRIALAVNSRDELPPDPVVKTEPTTNGPRSVSAAIQYPPTSPILADGLFPPNAAATFLTPDFAFQYEFETFRDTGPKLEFFDRCRLHARD